MMAPGTTRLNPFPGLRPFREDEAHLFFGRESQVDTMVDKLVATRFLAVVGTSGSGKSSLVNCGLHPALHRGLMAGAGPGWRIAQFRPGSNPIKSLAESLAAEGVLFSGQEADIPIDEIIETYLNQSANGIVEAFRKARLPEGTNLLVVADQFEELFRYSKLEAAAGSDLSAGIEKAIAFVNLLLKAGAEPGYPIYVVITMRSDFLGDCSQFYGLPEAINRGQYLVPRMTRDERRASIAGPVNVGGAEISPVLLTRLVNDVGDNPDQLSILQHALNRTWACWEHHGAKGELGLEHYTEIGTMSEALNQHANEAFDLLETPRKKRICEKLFKSLTDLGTDARGIRRPLKLATLTEIAATSSEENEVKKVIEVFRDRSRAFLMPPEGEPLEPHKVIDISHESLMRVWKRLREWAEEESVSARRYRRLAETAVLEKTGNAALWSDPDLQLALDWKEEQAPTPTWASLYGGDFESAMAFLKKSQAQRDHELAQAIFARRWNRLRRFIILLVVAILLLRYRDLDWWSEWWSVEKAIEFHRAQGPAEVALNLWKMAKVVFALTCFFGPYFLIYLALAYPAKRIFRRLGFAKILREVALSSSKAVREEKLARQTVRDAAVALQTTYAGFWRRAGASLLDVGLLVVAWMALGAAFNYANPKTQPASEYLAVGVFFTIVGGHWLYHALMLRSRRQATLGMLALGIFATDKNGNRLHFGKATLRHFAKILSCIPLGIGFFVQPFTPKRRTLHDLIAGSVVLVRPERKKLPWWLIALCIILGLVEAFPVAGLILILFKLG
jgi:uncharacterized RDD family membrane protein YckC